MVVLLGLWVKPELRGSELTGRVSSVILGLIQRPLGSEQSWAARMVPITSPTDDFESLSVCFFLVVHEDLETVGVLADIRKKKLDLPVYVIKLDNSACGMPDLDHLCFTASKLWGRDRKLGRLLRRFAPTKGRSRGSSSPSNALLLKIRADLQGLSYYLPDETIVGAGK